jgi:hypothetical protein
MANCTRLRPLANAGAQEQRAQMLFDGARADVTLPGDLLIAATLYQQIKHLLIARRDFHLIQVGHDAVASTLPWESLSPFL